MSLHDFTTNDFVVLIVSLSSVLGFVISLYVSFKTKSISKELHKIKISKQYNKNRMIFIDRLNGYLTNILEDQYDPRKLPVEILSDYEKIEINYKLLFDMFERIRLKLAKYNLKKKKINFRNVSLDLTYFIARLSKKEDLNA